MDERMRFVIRLKDGESMTSLPAEVQHAFQDAGFASGSQYWVALRNE